MSSLFSISAAANTAIGIVAAVLAVALVVFTVVYNVRKRKAGKGCGCSGDCSKCKACKNLSFTHLSK